MKISLKILLTMILILVFLIAIPSYIIINAFVEDQKKIIQKTMLEKNSNTMDKISRLIAERVVNLRNLSNPGNKILANPSFSASEKLNYLQTFQQNAKSYSTISIYDVNGIRIMDSENVNIGKNYSRANFFTKALSGKVYVDKLPTYEIDFQQYILHLSAPLHDADKKTVGIIVLNFPMTKIAGLLGREGYTDTDVDLLTDNGLVIYSNHDLGSVLHTWKNMSVFQEISQSQESSIAGFSKDSENNQVIFSASKDLGSNAYFRTGWILITNEETQVAFSKVNELQNNLMWISFAILTISVALVILFSRMITKPITRLIRMSKEISSGNFSVREEIKDKDEFSELIHSFNNMSRSLHEYHERLIRMERLSSIGKLSSRIAHDLRNPLSVINNTIEIIKIQNPDFEQKNKEKFDKLERAVKRMTHQIEEVMDYVLPKPLDFKNTSLLEVMNSAISNVKTGYTKIHLPQNDVNIICDQIKLEIVFTNLLLNATQAMDNRGDVYLRISSTDKDNVTIEVEDTGPGIPFHLLPKIFDPLFTTRQIGTGLGLVSCKTIITMHCGTMYVRSKLGEGTTFIIKMPITPSDISEMNASEKALQKIQNMNDHTFHSHT